MVWCHEMPFRATGLTSVVECSGELGTDWWADVKASQSVYPVLRIELTSITVEHGSSVRMVYCHPIPIRAQVFFSELLGV